MLYNRRKLAVVFSYHSMQNKIRLILLRHAKSDWNSGVSGDFDRPLAPRGRNDAPRTGQWMKDNGVIPDIILCSPALRTRQTLAAVNDKLGVAHIVYEDAIYGASLRVLLGLVEDYGRDSGNLMITGHNPGMDELLCYLCATPPPRTETGKLMTTAALAVLGFAGAGAMHTAAAGELLHLVRPGGMVPARNMNGSNA